ncbi:hypothetical protein [Horticoccus sp. 23ND18S-11]|uniref:hypothetical protein n=1 Tax=Horticoccus sp. 23ND18S-11 TaxID=3391832 RepID=UPI0039C920FC
MAAIVRLLFLLIVPAATVCAAPPSALASALEYLRDQKSYSWEVINSDPGPVAQQFETRRGTVTTVQQSMAPNLKGQLDRNGDMLIQREWPDGLRLDTVIGADGAMITSTPEGWMTDREILTAQAEERLRGQAPTARYQWLRRADRPDIRRPDQELVPFLKSNGEFESLADSFIARIRSRAGDPAKPNEDDAEPATTVMVTMNLRGGVIRDYEVKVEGVRRATRARIAVPVSEQRIVILTYVPVNRINLPAEAREKMKTARPSPGGRAP